LFVHSKSVNAVLEYGYNDEFKCLNFAFMNLNNLYDTNILHDIL